MKKKNRKPQYLNMLQIIPNYLGMFILKALLSSNNYISIKFYSAIAIIEPFVKVNDFSIILVPLQNPKSE